MHNEINKKFEHSPHGRGILQWEDMLHELGFGGVMDKKISENFAGSLSIIHDASGYGVFDYKIDSFGYQKGRWDCAHFPSHNYSLTVVRSGNVQIEQGGRCAVFQGGEVFLRSNGDPNAVIANELDVFTLIVPAEIARGMLASPDDATALRLNYNSPWGQALTASMTALTPETFRSTSVPARAIVEQMATLLALTLEGTQPLSGSYKTSLLRRIKENMREHLADADYSPASLASEMDISKRLVHAIFAEFGTSFGRELTLMRLQKARDYLDCAAFSMKSIKEISAMVGYGSPSLFTLRFRQAFGLPPADYRRIRHS